MELGAPVTGRGLSSSDILFEIAIAHLFVGFHPRGDMRLVTTEGELNRVDRRETSRVRGVLVTPTDQDAGRE